MRENRKHDRCKLETLLPLYDFETNDCIGELANISENGAMIVTQGPVKSMTEFKCRLILPNKILNSEEICFTAECLWCRKNVSSNRYESGYKLKASPKNKELISYLVLSYKLGNWGSAELDKVKTVEMENRRKFERYEFDKPLSVFKLHSYHQIGQLADLSSHGARLTTKKPIEISSLLGFRVLLPKEIFKQEYLVFEATCMWSRKRKEDDLYDSGYEIVNISETDKIVIEYLLTHCSKKSATQKKILVID